MTALEDDLRKRAKAIAAEANECCNRSDGYKEEIEDLALQHLAAVAAPQSLVGVQRPEDVARIVEIVNTSVGPLNATERADLADEIAAILALPHTGQPQEGELRQIALDAAERIVGMSRERDSTCELKYDASDCLSEGADEIVDAIKRALSAAHASPRAEGEWNYDLDAMPVEGRFEALREHGEVFRHLPNEHWVIIPKTGRMFVPLAWRPAPPAIVAEKQTGAK